MPAVCSVPIQLGRGLCQFDRDGRMMWCNDHFADSLSVAEEVVVEGVSLADFLVAIAHTQLRRTVASAALSRTHCTARFPDFEIGVTGEPLPDGGFFLLVETTLAASHHPPARARGSIPAPKSSIGLTSSRALVTV